MIKHHIFLVDVTEDAGELFLEGKTSILYDRRYLETSLFPLNVEISPFYCINLDKGYSFLCQSFGSLMRCSGK